MSKKRKDLHRRQRVSSEDRKLHRYFDMLVASGMDEREATRAVVYAKHYGFKALTPPNDECVIFHEPTCANWNCLSPEHQVLVFEDHGGVAHEHSVPDR